MSGAGAGVRATLLRPLAHLFSRVMRTPAAQRFVAPVVSPVQMRLYRLTGGRFQLSALLVPSLVLRSTGARSGQRRETPLMCWPRPDGSFLVAGSNWGLARHPAWTANLLADPDAAIVHRGRTVRVRAQLLEGSEREAAWPLLEAQWPRYREYERSAGRALRIFRLTPVAGAGG